MRVWVLVLVAGCTPAPRDVVPVPNLARGCDAAWWNEAAKEPRRAWLTSGAPPSRHRPKPVARDAPLDHVPLAVIDTQEDDVLLADLRDTAMVARWSPLGALAPVVRSEVAVSPAPREPGDVSLRVLPGLRVGDDATGDWIEIGTRGVIDGFQIHGFVPRSSIGSFWEQPAPSTLRTYPVPSEAVIRHEPTDAAPIVAVIAPGTRVSVRANATGWLEVTAIGEHVIADGYMKPWPARDPLAAGEGTDIGPAEPAPGPFPPGTCLYDTPHGNTVGIVRGRLDTVPLPTDEAGWFGLDVATAWGELRLYTNHAPGGRRVPGLNDLVRD